MCNISFVLICCIRPKLSAGGIGLFNPSKHPETGKYPKKFALVESDDSGKYFSEKSRKIVKLEKQKPS